MNEQTSTLYDAAVGFMVSERTGNDSWEKVVKAVVAFATEGKSPAEIRKEFAAVEAAIRKDFKVEGMPTAWRTAKSTALSAVAAGVALINNDDVLPKTEVAKALAAGKVTPARSGEDRLVDGLVASLARAMTLCTISPSAYAEATLHLKAIQSRLDSIR